MPWQPEFHTDQPENDMQPFPLPDDASIEIRSRLANLLQRYTLLKVWTTDDDGRQMTPDYAILIAHPILQLRSARKGITHIINRQEPRLLSG